MDDLFNYFKLYFVNDIELSFHNDNLISGKKYLIKDLYDYTDVFIIGIVFKRITGYNEYYYSKYNGTTLYFRYINDITNARFYELVDDFSLTYCDDLILSHYLINNINKQVGNCIYTYKHFGLIFFSNSLKNINNYNNRIISNNNNNNIGYYKLNKKIST